MLKSTRTNLGEIPIQELTQFFILENFLDINIKLRLRSDDEIYGEEGNNEANEISTIISKLIGILNRKYNGKIPTIEIIDNRKMIAKLLGLSLYKVSPECLIKIGNRPNGSCCDLHRLEGLKESHEIFPRLLDPLVEKEDLENRWLKTFLELKIQIIKLELIKNYINGQNQNLLENLLELYFGSLNSKFQNISVLQDASINFRKIVQEDGLIEEKLNEKFPFKEFENNLKEFINGIYSDYPKTFLDSIVSTETILNISENECVNGNSEVIRATESNSSLITDSTKSINPSASTDLNSTNVTTTFTQHLSHSQSDEKSLFKGVIISGKFFRGILEPIDERFATIIEGRDVNVKQYLAQRKKLKLKPTPRPRKKVKSVTNSNDSGNQDRNSSLLDRHNSAERISWETQEITVDHNTPCTDHCNSSNDKKKENDKPPFVRGRRRFTDKEVANLIEGVRRFGHDWRRIRLNYEFEDRNNVNLKDKARNLEKLGFL